MWQLFSAANYLIAVLIAIAIKWLYDQILLTKCLPSGPWGLPIVGYLPWIKKNAHESFVEIAKKYGPVFSIKLGHMTAVVLNDHASIKAALVDSAGIFTGRPDILIFDSATNKNDVATQEGTVWKRQRSLMVKILSNIGAGKKSMESKAMNIIYNVMDELKTSNGKVVSMESLFFSPILKCNWNLLSGHNFDENDHEIKQFDGVVSTLYHGFSTAHPVNLFPWLRFIPPNGFGYWEKISSNKVLRDLLNKLVAEHLSESEDGLGDFIGHHLAENKKKEIENGKPIAPYTDENLLGSLWDLFLAGVDTTNCTSQWGFLFLACNPDVQKRAQNEMDAVVGRHRLPNLEDIPNLPYLEAVIMEIHRKASVTALSFLHRSLAATEILGHKIPKGTTCIQNIYAVHHDSKLWEEPHRFYPERFLDKDNKVTWPKYLMPFSIGPRTCPAQTLAQLELRLIFSCLLHKFTFILPDNMPKPSFDPIVRLNLKPRPYALRIQFRED